MSTQLKFPDGFLWGAALASYQVEGGIEHNDWAQAARSGRVPACGRACDHFNRFEEDFDIAVNLGHNAHRLSLEWARIEPMEGVFDEEAIEHYRNVLRALKRRGIVPFVTIWHFTQPLWFSSRGSFLHKDASRVFARYCRTVIEKLGDEADYWQTINEPLVWASIGYVRGAWPPFKTNPIQFLRLTGRLAHAHNEAYVEMKKVKSNIHIGIAKHNINFEGNGFFGSRLADAVRWFWNRRFLDKTVGHHDFIGLNHYRRRVFFRDEKDEEISRNDMGWELHPKSIHACLLELKRYGLPIYITENGLADADDSRRASFIAGYLREVRRAIEDGVDVRGYFHWSLLDNYEWAEGFTPRFGLVEIDYATLTRKIRPSARVYEAICRTNALREE